MAHSGLGLGERHSSVATCVVAMLENEDIQHIRLDSHSSTHRATPSSSFREPGGGRAWLTVLLETGAVGGEVLASVEEDERWVTVAFRWNCLRALGVDEASPATFPRVQARHGCPCGDPGRHR